jgi:hypothetical protein
MGSAMNSERLIVGGVLGLVIYWFLSSGISDGILTQIVRGDDIEKYECADVVKVVKDLELQNALGAKFSILYIENTKLISRDKRKIVCHGNVRTSYSEDRMELIVRKLDDGQVFVEVKEIIDKAAPAQSTSDKSNINPQSSSNDLQTHTQPNSAIRSLTIPEEVRRHANKFFASDNWSIAIKEDFNNDNVQDFLISGETSMWCGSAGCSHIALFSTGDAFQLQELGNFFEVEKSGGSFFVHAHGGACNLPGSRPCQFEIVWDGQGLNRRK